MKNIIKYISSFFLIPYYIGVYIKIKKIKKTENGYVIISPSLTLSGAPLLSKAIYDELSLRDSSDCILMSIYGGEFSKSAGWDCYNLRGCRINFIKNKIIKLLIIKGYAKFICNSVVSSELSSFIKNNGAISVSLIHEMGNVIKSFRLEKSIESITNSSKQVVFSSSATFNDYITFLPEGYEFSYRYLKQGVYNAGIISNYPEKRIVRERVRGYLNIDSDKKVILGIGNDLERKGFHYFQQLSLLNKDDLFIWVSDNESVTPFLTDNLIRLPMVSLEKTYELFFIADVFFLSSIEDPFPSVILEAMFSGLPVISIMNSGGADEIVNDTNGYRVSREKIEDANDFLHSLDMRTLQKFEKNNHTYIKENYSLARYVDLIINLF